MTTPCQSREPEYLTRQETADLLRVDIQTVDRLGRSGKLTRYTIATGDQRSRTRYRADQVRGLIRPEVTE